ncbi:Uncharacterised protein [Mesomycoplasma conjunctivae]|uniref:Uncharacterized protein n=1 Tax=Mesomycoplasma conjunctivae (strain ATCC 25834 / NCTC 10147 / HRC/581) TaxID=572263 RepID=C5J6L1_MESCH|nr:hypothetical protein [Mesomycoplasma conjunctivae]CAT05106.1 HYPOTHETICAL PROTEIN MCJ_004170 [Mesomycoplasma conjunctivae]VEU66380.1 Uncharacterised protein [Mesomycoplasma conjunctivae]
MNKLNDYKKYYLLSDEKGTSGIFIQRVDKLQRDAAKPTMEGEEIATKDNGVSYVIGVDTTLERKQTSKALIISGPLYEEVKKTLRNNNQAAQNYFSLVDTKPETSDSASLNLRNNTQDTLSALTTALTTSPPLTNPINVNSNFFLQSQKQADLSSHNGGLRDNEILLISIVKTKASIELSLQTSNSYDPKNDITESSLSQVKFGAKLGSSGLEIAQDSIKDFEFENSFNWNKLGFDANTMDSETKFILKGFAVFNDPRLVANKLANKNIRKAFVDTYLIKK